MHTAGIKKDNRIFLIISYVISALLLAYYLYVLFLGVHPKVTKEFRMFYIDHELKYRVPEGALAVKPGVTLCLDGREDSETTFYGVGQGFAFEYTGHAMENTGYCYTTGEHNLLYFDETGSGAHTLKLHVKDVSLSGEVSSAQKADIFVNGVFAGRYDFVSGNTVLVDITPEAAGNKLRADGTDLVVDIMPETEGAIQIDSLVFD